MKLDNNDKELIFIWLLAIIVTLLIQLYKENPLIICMIIFGGILIYSTKVNKNKRRIKNENRKRRKEK